MDNLFDRLFKNKDKSENDEIIKSEDNILKDSKSKIPLIFDYGTSDFKKELLYDEYEKLVKDQDEYEDTLEVYTLSVYHGYEGVEVSVFIKNTSDNIVELYNTNLILMDPEGKKLAEKVINFKGEVRISPKSSFFYEILFEDIFLDEEIKELQVNFSSFKDIKASYIKDMDMENLLTQEFPEDIKEFLREKFYEIPSIREGEFILDPLCALGEQNGINVLMLLRNASEREITINSMPLKVYFTKNIPIYIGTFNMMDNGFSVEKNKGKLVSFRIPKEVIMGEPIINYVYTVEVK